jgi:hypothetical protein
MDRKTEIYTFLGLVASILSCIAGWIAVPQIQKRLENPSSETGLQVLSSTPAIFASVTVEPDATSTPVLPTVPPTPIPPTATQKPTSTPVPILYEANWSDGPDGWSGPGWQHVDGKLVNNGTNTNTYLRTIAPYQLNEDNYAVEAEIRLVSYSGANSAMFARFGLFARSTSDDDGYEGVHSHFNEQAMISVRTPGWQHSPERLDGNVFSPDDEWHTYRLEVRGNNIKLFIDGGQFAEAVDNRYLKNGQVGIISYIAMIDVRSFRVVKLE